MHSRLYPGWMLAGFFRQHVSEGLGIFEKYKTQIMRNGES